MDLSGTHGSQHLQMGYKMKKTILATLTAAVVAGTAALVAPAAEAGSLTVHSKGAYTVEISWETSTGIKRHELIPAGSQFTVHSEFNGQKTDEITYNILFSGNGDQTWKVPQGKDEHQILHFHGNLWNPWISN